MKQVALILAFLLISGCAGTPPCQEPPKRQPIVVPSECLSPVLPEKCELGASFDGADLEPQGKAAMACHIRNSKRMLTGEAIMARCAKWAADISRESP